MKNTINRFSGTRFSGLLKELTNRFDNGGIDEIHLDLFLHGQNPFDPVLRAYCECKFFFREVFNIGFQLTELKLPESYNPKRHHFIIIPPEKKLPLGKIIKDWEEKTGERVVTQNYGSQELLIPLQLESSFDYPKYKVEVWSSGLMKKLNSFESVSQTDKLKVLRGEVNDFTNFRSIHLRDTLLRLMFLYWKYQTIDCFTGIKKSQEDFLPAGKLFAIPCYSTRYKDQPSKKDKVSYPLVCIKDNKEIQIRPSVYHSANLLGVSILDIDVYSSTY